MPVSFAYDVERRPRRRRLAIQVTPEGRVRVLTPPRVSAAEIAALVEREQAWVERQLARHAQGRATHPPPCPEPGGSCPYLGTCYPVRFARTRTARLADGHLELPRRLEKSPPMAQRFLMNWYGREMRRLADERVPHFAGKLDVKPSQVRIRDMRSRWGSCSSKGNLSLNLRLIMAPPAVLDYVIVHELAHLHEGNHQRAFWDLVERICPDADTHRRWLREHGPYLRLAP